MDREDPRPIEVREASAADAAPIAALWNAVIAAPHITFTTVEKTAADVADLIATRQENGWPVLVAADGDAVRGYATYAPFRTGPGYRRTMEHSIALAPEARGRGVGRSLMDRLAAIAAERGVRSLVACISGANPAAIAFHERCGFAPAGLLRDAGWKGGVAFDLVLMQRLLP